MAPRKKKAGAKAPEADKPEAVKPGEVLQMVPEKPLLALLALDKRTKKQQSELAGEIGQKVGEICERYGTNRKALSVIRTLNRMEPEKLADFLDHFDYLLDVSGLEKRAADVQRLPLNEPAGEADGEGAGDGAPAAEGDGKVSRPQFGARAVAAAE